MEQKDEVLLHEIGVRLEWLTAHLAKNKDTIFLPQSQMRADEIACGILSALIFCGNHRLPIGPAIVDRVLFLEGLK